MIGGDNVFGRKLLITPPVNKSSFIQAFQAIYPQGTSSVLPDGSLRTEYDPNMYWGYTFSEDREIRYEDYQFDYGYHRFIYKRVFLLDHDIFFPPYLRFQDPPFFVKAMITAGSFYALHDVTYRYRKTTSSKSISSNKKKVKDSVLGYTDDLQMAKQHQLQRLYRLTIDRCVKENWGILQAAEDFHDAEIDCALKALDETIDLSLYDQKIGHLYKLRFLRKAEQKKPNSAGKTDDKKTAPEIQKPQASHANPAIPAFLRLTAGGIRCLKDNGLRYTVRQLKNKISGR